MKSFPNQKIDFLPASYLLQRKHHRQQQFRLLTCVAVIALCLVGTYGQRARIAGLQSRQYVLNSQYNQLCAQLADQQQLESQKKQLEAKANLLAHLKLRPSVSRLLSVVTAARPQHVSLSSWMLEAVPRAQNQSAKKLPPAKRSQKISEEQPVKLASLLDLEQLQEQKQSNDLKIQLTGTAPDDVAISTYLASLEQCGMADEVRLIYTDHYSFQNEELRKFVIEVIIRKPQLITPPEATEVAALSAK